MTNLAELHKRKQEKQKFAALALYDASFAALAEKAGVKVLLVGDSLGMVLHNKPNTLHVSMDTMVYHTACVAAGASTSLILADMPFGSYTNRDQALANAARLLRAGAQMVKIEGGMQLLDYIPAFADNAIPVCVHLGLTPQFIHFFDGFKAQGQDQEQADIIYEASMKLCEAGANMLLLECIPASLAKIITSESSVPVIGIGAGWDTDGQVLVSYDALGIGTSKAPRFVRNFLQDCDSVQQALSNYVKAVEQLDFPSQQHIY